METYQEIPLLKKVVDPLGSVTSFVHDEFGNVIQTVDPLGRKSSFRYDPLQRLLEATDPAGSATTFEHAKFCGETKVVDPLGRATVAHRDMLCRITEVELPDGGPVKTAYDDEGNVASVTDQLGNTTRFRYDKLGRIVEVRDALNGTETRTYDAHGNLVAATDRRGNTSRFEFDAVDRLKKLIRRDGTSVSFSYDRDGLLTSVTDARASTWKFEYDKAGRMTTALSPSGEQTVRNVYDAAGRLLERLSAMGRKVQFEYDQADRLLAVTDPLGHRTTRVYDQTGNLRTVTDPTGRSAHLEYDKLDQLVAVTDPAGGVVRRVLDAVGNLVQVLDQNGNPTSYEYDYLDRVISEVYADGTRLEWEYDLAGNLVLQKDPRGFQTKFEYDKLHRLSRIRYDDEPEATFAHDSSGNLVRRTDGTGTYLFEHDREGRVTAFVQGTGSRYQVRHDAEGNQTELVFPDGSRQRTEYDSSGRVSALLTPDGKRTAYSYDADGRRTRIDRPNGTYSLYEYDRGSRLSRLAHLRTNGTKVTPDFRMSHDEAGNVLSVTDEGTPLWTYGYDTLDRLTEAVDHQAAKSWQWSYDAVGNRLTETLNGTNTRSRYNTLNQLLRMGDTQFWYDQAGNLAQKSGPGGASSYRFDSRNRLVEVITGGSQRVAYTYDSAGRMDSRNVGTGKSTRLEWDGWDLVREVAPDGGETTFHASRSELNAFAHGNRMYQVHSDSVTSVRNVTDGSGISVSMSDFDAWGNLLESSESLGTPVAARYVGALGARTEAVAGLVYMRHRWYDPGVARFISRDPLRNQDRLYSYAANRPLNFVDPDGLDIASPSASSKDSDLATNPFILDMMNQPYHVGDAYRAWHGSRGQSRPSARESIANAAASIFPPQAERMMLPPELDAAFEQTGVPDSIRPTLAAFGFAIFVTLVGRSGGGGCGEFRGSITPIPRSTWTTSGAGSTPRFIYRRGWSNAGSFKFRPEDMGELSFWLSLRAGQIENGARYVVVDTKKLPPGSVVVDGEEGNINKPPGHVSVLENRGATTMKLVEAWVRRGVKDLWR